MKKRTRQRRCKNSNDWYSILSPSDPSLFFKIPKYSSTKFDLKIFPVKDIGISNFFFYLFALAGNGAPHWGQAIACSEISCRHSRQGFIFLLLQQVIVRHPG